MSNRRRKFRGRAGDARRPGPAADATAPEFLPRAVVAHVGSPDSPLDDATARLIQQIVASARVDDNGQTLLALAKVAAQDPERARLVIASLAFGVASLADATVLAVGAGVN